MVNVGAVLSAERDRLRIEIEKLQFEREKVDAALKTLANYPDKGVRLCRPGATEPATPKAKKAAAKAIKGKREVSPLTKAKMRIGQARRRGVDPLEADLDLVLAHNSGLAAGQAAE